MQQVILTIALTVNWGGVTGDETFPVTGGIPIARGALADAKFVRLLLDGTPIPVQTDALAFFRPLTKPRAGDPQ